MKLVTGNTTTNNIWVHRGIDHVYQFFDHLEAAIIILAKHLYAVFVIFKIIRK